MELVVGCRNAAELARLKRFLRRFLVLPVSDPVSHRAYSLMQSFTLSHGLLMAATALEHGLPLYTRNVRHFHMITGLPVIRPY
jgi:predicted nucleic acid-binding protein